jgi:hypothetical protein
MIHDLDKIQAALRAILGKLNTILCNTSTVILGTTELDPPVDAPAAAGPTVLINLTTGGMWYWDGDSWEALGGGGALPYYELEAKLSTDGTTNVNFTIVSNTFPFGWTVGSAGGGYFPLIYGDAGLDLYTVAADIVTKSTAMYNTIDSAPAWVSAGYVYDVHELGFTMFKGVGLGTHVDFDAAICVGVVEINVRLYY